MRPTSRPVVRVLLHVRPRLFADALRSVIVGRGFHVDDEPGEGTYDVAVVHDDLTVTVETRATIGVDEERVSSIVVEGVDLTPSEPSEDRAADLLDALENIAQRSDPAGV